MVYTFPHIVGNEALDKAYGEFFMAPTLEARRASWFDDPEARCSAAPI